VNPCASQPNPVRCPRDQRHSTFESPAGIGHVHNPAYSCWPCSAGGIFRSRLKPPSAGGEHPQEVPLEKGALRSGGSNPGSIRSQPARPLGPAIQPPGQPSRNNATPAAQQGSRLCGDPRTDRSPIRPDPRSSFGNCPEPGQLTCPYRALQWARKHLSKIQSSQSFSQRAGVLLAALRQWKIVSPYVDPSGSRRLAVDGPNKQLEARC